MKRSPIQPDSPSAVQDAWFRAARDVVARSNGVAGLGDLAEMPRKRRRQWIPRQAIAQDSFGRDGARAGATPTGGAGGGRASGQTSGGGGGSGPGGGSGGGGLPAGVAPLGGEPASGPGDATGGTSPALFPAASGAILPFPTPAGGGGTPPSGTQNSGGTIGGPRDVGYDTLPWLLAPPGFTPTSATNVAATTTITPAPTPSGGVAGASDTTRDAVAAVSMFALRTLGVAAAGVLTLYIAKKMRILR